MKDVLLKGINVSKSYSRGGVDVSVLRNIDIEIYRDDFTVIMGPSGAGKSTLLYALSGMDKISDGQVFYRGEEISRFSEKQMAELRAREFGFVFQQTHLVTNLTLFENVAVTGYLDKSKSQKEIDEKAINLLDKMNVRDALDHLPHQSSGGEAQRAAIARSVINDPGLLFADEPTGALNRSHSDDVFRLLADLHESGQSILMVTHDLRAAIRGTRILYLEDGKILDELDLPSYQSDSEKDREDKVSRWLSDLSW